ncbi:MAG: hypothetical protein D6816_12890, partial [Bacteroidetes bacterium]
MTKFLPLFSLILSLFFACGNPQTEQQSSQEETPADSLRYEQEKHLKNIKQLTWGGDNAEAYFSSDNQKLVFQATNPAWGTQCDQIYVMDAHKGLAPGETAQLISTGKGKTTCSFFLPGNEEIIFASTHHQLDTCPATPRVVNGKYVWAIHPEFDLFVADLNGNILRQLTDEPGYDAEATVSPDGTKIVFTSTRSGDLELW